MIYLMKTHIVFFSLFLTSLAYSQLPEGFVYVKDVAPTIEVDLRYNSSNNFLGKRVNGYHNNCLILTEAAALALVKVENELKLKNLGLKVFDGYRPQRAVNHFITWAKTLSDTLNKAEYYPKVMKKNLFKEEYIASRSGHTKGSTVDLTLINLSTKEELDMGSPYDFFGRKSWINYQNLSETQKAHRALLQGVMLKHGFRNYAREWWHFTLNQQPFPNTYFDFPVE